MTDNGDKNVWHIDPVDGTRNFANGLPIFGVSIALVRDHVLTVGVIYNPASRSLFYTEKGKGSYLNGRRIFVSKDDTNQGIVTVSPTKKDKEKKLWRELMHDLPIGVVRSVRDFGCTAMQLAYVARGGLEANIELGLNTYDFAAGALLVEEAGGKITLHDGTPWKFPENEFIASNGVFHDKLVEEVKRQKEKLGIK